AAAVLRERLREPHRPRARERGPARERPGARAHRDGAADGYRHHRGAAPAARARRLHRARRFRHRLLLPDIARAAADQPRQARPHAHRRRRFQPPLRGHRALHRDALPRPRSAGRRRGRRAPHPARVPHPLRPARRAGLSPCPPRRSRRRPRPHPPRGLTRDTPHPRRPQTLTTRLIPASRDSDRESQDDRSAAQNDSWPEADRQDGDPLSETRHRKMTCPGKPSMDGFTAFRPGIILRCAPKALMSHTYSWRARPHPAGRQKNRLSPSRETPAAPPPDPTPPAGTHSPLGMSRDAPATPPHDSPLPATLASPTSRHYPAE